MKPEPPVRTSLWKRSGLSRFWVEIVLCLGLILLTALALGRACSCDFVNYDDNVYVTTNIDMGPLDFFDFARIKRAFTTTRSNHFHPLTWMSLQADVDPDKGIQAWRFHLTNLLLHTANVLLLFGLLRQMTGAAVRSAFVAALFAIHPLHVESVAWVTERKDVLSTFFWLLATIAYVHYTRKPSWRRYLGVVPLFVLGLLAKPMLITMPFTLLLLDYWPLRRWPARAGVEEGKQAPAFAPAPAWKLVVEKVPLVLLAVASGVASLYAREQGGGLKSGDYLSLPDRFGNAANAYVGYLDKLFWPRELAPFYPISAAGLRLEHVVTSAAVLVLLTVLLLATSRRWPYLGVGWLWYLGTLLPVSGIVQLGSYALADRYAYVPSIGLFLALVWGTADLLSRAVPARVLAPAGLLLLIALAVVSYRQVGFWRDSIALWEHAQAVTEDNFFTRTKLGEAYTDSGRTEDAEAQFRAAIQRRPDVALAYSKLGHCLMRQGRTAEAVALFGESVKRQLQEPQATRYRDELRNALWQVPAEDWPPLVADICSFVGQAQGRPGAAAGLAPYLVAVRQWESTAWQRRGLRPTPAPFRMPRPLTARRE
jgi:hypothetical protein